MATSDISRNIFDKKKNYRSVRMQQGRVLTDDDWNENERIHSEIVRGTNRDVIGRHGSPNEGFKIGKDSVPTTGNVIDFDILSGVYYLGGLRLEMNPDQNDNPQTFRTQKDWLEKDTSGYAIPAITTGEKRYDLVYLVAWQQPVTAVEDAELYEAALGGPDTATRMRNMAQVKLYTDTGHPDCINSWKELINLWEDNNRGALNEENELITDTKLTVTYSEDGASDDLCAPSIGGGYLGAENQAIRVQLTGNNQFTWGFDNASSLYRIEVVGAETGIGSGLVNIFKLITTPKDQHHWPLAGQVVEILPWSAVLTNGEKTAGLIGQFSKVKTSYNPDTSEIIIDDPISEDYGKEWTHRTDSGQIGEVPAYLFMRVWNRGADLTSSPKIDIEADPVPLGHTGLEITITGNHHQPADYWIIAARPETPDQVVPWKLEEEMPPHGIHRYVAPLAIIEWSHSGILEAEVHDCRNHFPALAQMTNLYYVSGDGQEAMPEDTAPLPEPLRVRVSNGALPVQKAQIEFSVLDDETITHTEFVATDDKGIASYEWTIGNQGEQKVEAYLLDKAGNRIEDKCIIFTANLSKADEVRYDPGICTKWEDAPTTVQAALDELCDRESGGGCRVTVGNGGQYASLDVAIYELLEKNKADICLCMLPGEQESETDFGFTAIAELVAKLSSEGESVHLKVVGCGPGTRVILNAPILLQGFASVIIKDLEIAAGKFDGLSDNLDRPYALSIESVAEVSMSGCHIWGYANNTTDPLILIKEATKIYLENNLFERHWENIEPPDNTVYQDIGKFQPMLKVIKSEYLREVHIYYSNHDYTKTAITVAHDISGLNLEERKKISITIKDNAAMLQNEELKQAYDDLADAVFVENDDRTEEEIASTVLNKIKDIRETTMQEHTGCALTIFCNTGKMSILHNSIYGLVTLNTFADKMLKIDKNIRQMLFDRVNNEGIPLVNDDCAQLDLLNNKLTRINTVSQSSYDKLITPPATIDEGVYRMDIRGNSFLMGRSVLLTEYSNIDCNFFEKYEDNDEIITLAYAIAHSAVYMGNQARHINPLIDNIPFHSAKSANLPDDLVIIT